MDRFENLGIIKNSPEFNENQLNNFSNTIHGFKLNMKWTKKEIVSEFIKMIPKFDYYDTGRYLDGKM